MINEKKRDHTLIYISTLVQIRKIMMTKIDKKKDKKNDLSWPKLACQTHEPGCEVKTTP
jgi:hypothetical protein